MKVFLGLLALVILFGVGCAAYYLYIESLPENNRPVLVRKITKEVVTRTGGKVEEPPKPPKKDPIKELNKKIDSLNKKLDSKQKSLQALKQQMAQAIETKKTTVERGFSRGKSLSTISKDQSDIRSQQQMTQNLVKTQNAIRSLKYEISAAKRKLWRLKKKMAAAATEGTPAPAAE